MKVLIADDFDGVRRAIRMWLEIEFPLCEVSEATDGGNAVALAREEKPDVILMDIGMPGMNGLEATRAIRAFDHRVKILVLTVHEGSAYSKEAMAAGADRYIPKRLMHTDLFPVMKTWLPCG
jgi:DNA-binding NarL/FixJ family response regulator